MFIVGSINLHLDLKSSRSMPDRYLADRLKAIFIENRIKMPDNGLVKVQQVSFANDVIYGTGEYNCAVTGEIILLTKEMWFSAGDSIMFRDEKEYIEWGMLIIQRLRQYYQFMEI